MDILTIVAIAGGVVGAISSFDNSNKTRTIAAGIRSEAVKEASNNKNWFDETTLSWKKANAESVLRKFQSEESKRINDAFNSDAGAKEAVRTLNKLNKQYDAAKKAIDNFKGNSVSVAVGSGDNAAAVNITDESQKAILESRLADITAERDTAKEAVHDIRKAIADKITDERPIEHTEAIEICNKAKAEYQDAVKRNQLTVESLFNDNEWRHKQFVKEYQAVHSETELIGKACLMSVLPVAALVIIWKGTFEGLSILKEEI